MKYLNHFACFKDHVILISFHACSLVVVVVVEIMVIFCTSTPYSHGNVLLKRYLKKDRRDGRTKKNISAATG